MSDDEERREKKKRRKRSRKSKTKEQDTVEDVETNEENTKHDDESPVPIVPSQDTTPTKQEDTEDNGQDKPKRKRKRKRKSKQTEGGETAASGTGDEKLNSDKLTSLDLTAYVEGIPFDSTEEDVRDFFVSNGCEDILQLRLPRCVLL